MLDDLGLQCLSFMKYLHPKYIANAKNEIEITINRMPVTKYEVFIFSISFIFPFMKEFILLSFVVESLL